MPTTNKAATTSSALRYVLISLSLTALGIVIWKMSDVIVIAFGGLVLAAALRAASDPLSKICKISSNVSLTVVVLGGIAVVSMLAWLFGHQAGVQMAELQQQLPAAAVKFEAWLKQTKLGRELWDLAMRTAADSKFLSNVGFAATAFAGSVANLLLIGFLGIYFAIDPGLYRDGALRLLPPARRAEVGAALNDAAGSLRRWLLGQLIAMVVVGVAVGVALALIGVPQAAALGVFMGLCEFVPVVGPIVAAVPGLLLAFAMSPELAFSTFIVYVVIQQLESNLLIPVIQRWATHLAPAIGLLAVVGFGILLGLVGVVFATPIAVVLVTMVRHLYVEDALEHHPFVRGSARRSTAQ